MLKTGPHIHKVFVAVRGALKGAATLTVAKRMAGKAPKGRQTAIGNVFRPSAHLPNNLLGLASQLSSSASQSCDSRVKFEH